MDLVNTNMKRMLVIPHNLSLGGVSISLLSFVSAMAELGWNIDVVVPSSAGLQHDYLEKLSTICQISVHDEKRYPFLKQLPYIRNYYEEGQWFERRTAEQLYRYYVGEKIYDVEIAFYHTRPLKIIAGSPNENSKKILWFRAEFETNNMKFGGYPTYDGAISALSRYDAIICGSEGVKKNITDVIHYSDKVFIIPNLLNVDEIIKKSHETIDIEKKRFTAITVGRLSEEKGILMFLQAINILQKDGIQFDYWIIGDGPDKRLLEKYVIDNGIRGVAFLGYRANPYPWIKTADLYVSSSRKEAFGNSVADSILLNTPVLSTKCSGPIDILDDGTYGYLVNSAPEDLAEGFKDLFTHPEKLEYYRQQTYLRRSYFSPDRIIDGILEIIDK